jgi:predicted RNA-binding Zn ribbon-like protein
MVTHMTDHHDAGAEPDRETELFVEFANTLELEDGQPVDHVEDAAALRGWLAAHELCGARSPLAEVSAAVDDFRHLRELVHDVTERVAGGREPSRDQVRRINEVLRDGLHYHELQPAGDGRTYAMGHVGDHLAQARATIAGSLAHYLADHDLRRIRVCANDGCRWRFIDRSPAGRRRWCDMRTCGNRAKVARHRARIRRSGARRRAGAPTRAS